MKEAFVGFDSAWAGNRQGAISCAVFQRDTLEKVCLPQLADFSDAARMIEKLKKECDDVLVAIDQPIIVPNRAGSRPVDIVARTLMGRLRSGVQSASRTGKGYKTGMFGDNAPVWKFIDKIGPPGYSGGKTDLDDHRAFVDFRAAENATRQTHLIEVYPALALPALEDIFMTRRCAARYDPEKAKFSLCDWRLVCETVETCADNIGLEPLSEWASEMVKPWDSPKKPKKPHQDKIDAALCLIIALQWRRHRERYGLTAIGDLRRGYIVTPTSAETRETLEAACNARTVCFG